MTWTATTDARRKMPAERHSELLARAVAISRDEGLFMVTLRKVASDLGVTPGLVSHYFSSAEQLVAAAFRATAVADLDEARLRVAAASGAADKIDVLIDYVLDDCSMGANALWLEAWSLGRRNPALAAEADALTVEWLELIAEIVRVGRGTGEFRVARPKMAAWRLLTMIDGLAAQKVTRAVSSDEIKQIGRTYCASELGLGSAK
ncbi:TetR/AcrR family transcriptional regulator [Mycobacterium montefiorense]|nr:TetR family transcriptional regulator C-terminal domain-containing protein [Mycobacterium montefiorense]